MTKRVEGRVSVQFWGDKKLINLLTNALLRAGFIPTYKYFRDYTNRKGELGFNVNSRYGYPVEIPEEYFQ